MTVSKLRARIDRLRNLGTGLTIEEQRWRDCDVPLISHKERLVYAQALRKAIRGLAEAQAAVVNMLQRLEQEQPKRK